MWHTQCVLFEPSQTCQPVKDVQSERLWPGVNVLLLTHCTYFLMFTVLFLLLHRLHRSYKMVRVRFPFPTKPLVPPPDRSSIPVIERWLQVHQDYLKDLCKEDQKIYQRVRHNKNSKKNIARKMENKKERLHLAAVAKVRFIFRLILILYTCTFIFNSITKFDY